MHNYRTADFFNARHHNEQLLPHNIYQQKTHAVDEWMDGDYHSDDEMKLIYKRKSREELPDRPGFGQFEAQLNSVQHMPAAPRDCCCVIV